MSDPSRQADPVARARVGRVLKAKWRLETLLGVGGMGAVYAATHRNGRPAAVKVLHPALSGDEEVRRRFLREGYVANKIKHPGAVAILDDDVDEADGAVFLVMELLEGETLDARCKRCGGRLAPDEVLALTDELLDVLAAAHAVGVVHRDVKPDNIFLTAGGGMKVLDFGIARLRELSQVSDMATHSKFFMGTPAFMAPEQARSRWSEVDARTDIWAVGATMFMSVTGRPVHVAETSNEVMLAAMTKPAESVGALVPGLPRGLVDVVDRALAFDKGNRWPDARAMQLAVRGARVPEPRASAPERPSVQLTPAPVPAAVPDRAPAPVPDRAPVLVREPDTKRMPAQARPPEPAPEAPPAPAQPVVAQAQGPRLTTARGVTTSSAKVDLPFTGLLTRRGAARVAAGAILAAAIAVAAVVGWRALSHARPDEVPGAGLVQSVAPPAPSSVSASAPAPVAIASARAISIASTPVPVASASARAPAQAGVAAVAAETLPVAKVAEPGKRRTDRGRERAMDGRNPYEESTATAKPPPDPAPAERSAPPAPAPPPSKPPAAGGEVNYEKRE
jgi:serine/threonine-protein kinase